ncbi:MAG: hypothetical protein ACXV7D_08980, partial [Thermoanaerobaculia bacterium]
VWLLIFGDVLFLGKSLFLFDLSRYHFPMKSVVRDTILHGDFPWWNRLHTGGQPMAADPAYEIFYPGQWLIFLGSKIFGFNLHIVIHVWIALVGMFLFLREEELECRAALIGAFSFAIGGYFTTTLTILPTCFVWAWAPLAAYFLTRFRRRRRVQDFALAALILGMQVLVAEPVSLIEVWVLIGLAALADGFRDRKRLGSNVIAVALLLVCSLAVGAAQIVPGADHLRDTSRAEGLGYRHVTTFSTPLMRPVELFFPHFYGRHEQSGWYFWGASKFHGVSYLRSIYLGLLIAIGIVAATFTRPREAIPIVGFAFLVHFVAVGANSPLFNALYDLGIANRFRFPEKFLSLAVLPLIWLSCRAIDAYLRGDVRVKRAFVVTASVVATVSSIIAVFAMTPVYRRWFQEYWGLVDRDRFSELLDISRHDWTAAALAAIALTLILWAGGRVRPHLWTAAILGFVLFDLYQLHGDLSPRIPNRYYEPPGILNALDKPFDGYAVLHVGDWYLEYANPKYYEAGDQKYWLARNGLLPPMPTAWGVHLGLERDYDETYLRPTHDLVLAMLSLNLKGVRAWWQPFAAMANVRYVVDYRDFDVMAAECRGHFEISRPATLRRFAAFSPRYYLAREIIEAHDRDAVARIARARGVVPDVAYVPFGPFVPAPGRVLRVDESPSEARIEVEAAGQSYLVATVTPHRYWHVAIDGVPVEPRPTNIAFQGIVLPAGHHIVTMRYRNPLVVAGISISLLALAVIIFAIVRGGWKPGPKQ